MNYKKEDKLFLKIRNIIIEKDQENYNIVLKFMRTTYWYKKLLNKYEKMNFHPKLEIIVVDTFFMIELLKEINFISSFKELVGFSNGCFCSLHYILKEDFTYYTLDKIKHLSFHKEIIEDFVRKDIDIKKYTEKKFIEELDNTLLSELDKKNIIDKAYDTCRKRFSRAQEDYKKHFKYILEQEYTTFREVSLNKFRIRLNYFSLKKYSREAIRMI